MRVKLPVPNLSTWGGGYQWVLWPIPDNAASRALAWSLLSVSTRGRAYDEKSGYIKGVLPVMASSFGRIFFVSDVTFQRMAVALEAIATNTENIGAVSGLTDLTAAVGGVGSAVSGIPDYTAAITGVTGAVGGVGSAVSALPDYTSAIGGVTGAVGGVGSAVAGRPDYTSAIGGVAGAVGGVGSAVSALPDYTSAIGGVTAELVAMRLLIDTAVADGVLSVNVREMASIAEALMAAQSGQTVPITYDVDMSEQAYRTRAIAFGIDQFDRAIDIADGLYRLTVQLTTDTLTDALSDVIGEMTQGIGSIPAAFVEGSVKLLGQIALLDWSILMGDWSDYQAGLICEFEAWSRSLKSVKDTGQSVKEYIEQTYQPGPLPGVDFRPQFGAAVAMFLSAVMWLAERRAIPVDYVYTPFLSFDNCEQ